ncbi:MAG TPA: GGDEF domain-containing protein [Gallionella sp.]
MPEAVELLKQNLTIDSDLRNFVRLLLDSVQRLGGNCFSASVAALDLIEKTRLAGIGQGRPVPVSLVFQGARLFVVSKGQDKVGIANFDVPPEREVIAQLRAYLHNATTSVDPDILLQRNAEMERHFDEMRTRAERELEALQTTLKQRQRELQDVSHQAETDPLTGLYNRRAFDKKLKRAFLHTLRQRNSPLSLLYLDLDHFKKINDEFGHQVGDAHLNKMAGILRSIIREDVDMAFRFGGDEFAVVLFADYPHACSKARQVLKGMSNKVSIGITTLDQHTPEKLTLEEFIRQADNALYEAKRRGRGQVVSHCCTDMTAKIHRCDLPCADNLRAAALQA